MHPSEANLLMDRLRGGSDIWFFTLLFYDYILAMLWLRCLNLVYGRR
jgi:hypothetical protein